MADTIITVATTGAFPTKTDNPAVPLTPREIADDVFECWQAGAAIAHLHMRDDNGKGTMDKGRFVETVGRIRERCDIVLNLTTSGDLNATDETRMAHLIELKPEFASFDAGSMNWMHTTLFINHPAFLEKLAAVMAENRVLPEIEVFDPGMFYTAMHYIKKGILKPPGYFQFVLGAAGGIAATVENLVFLKSLLPANTPWSAFGIGAGHLPILYATLALGGHIRVGMEDNVFYAKGRLAKSNAEFVARAARLVAEANNQVATPEKARKLFDLPRGVANATDRLNVALTSEKFMEFEEANRLLDPGYLAFESGCKDISNRKKLVAALTRMPGCRAKMVNWWFSWLGGIDQYKLWHPRDHVASAWLNRVDGNYIGASHVVSEYLAGPTGPIYDLQIDFHDPLEIFDAERYRDSGSVAVCARIGDQGAPVHVGRMCHFIRNTDYGCEMRSRFWLGILADRTTGELVPEHVAIEMRKVKLNDDFARRLHQHATEEMGYLAEILPVLYRRNTWDDTF